MSLKNCIGKYDIRGIYGKTLNKEDGFKLGVYIANAITNYNNTKKFADITAKSQTEERIFISKDYRNSSSELVAAIIAGILSKNISYSYLGALPTPLLSHKAFSIKNRARNFYIMVTGSHNGPEYNGIKIMQGKRSICGKELKQLISYNKETVTISELDLKLISRLQDQDYDIALHSELIGNYIKYIKKIFNKQNDTLLYSKISNNTGKKTLKIAWDPGGGASCSILKQIINILLPQHLHFCINMDPDPYFVIRSPDPGSHNSLSGLRNIMQKEKCDIGFAFDGDGDRVLILYPYKDYDSKNINKCNSNKIVDKIYTLCGDEIFLLLAKREFILDQLKSTKLFCDIQTSSAILSRIENNFFAKTHFCPSGHSLIKEQLRLSKHNILAGEVSGHFYHSTHNIYGYDDGILNAFKIIDMLEQNYSFIEEEIDQLVNKGAFITPIIKLSYHNDRIATRQSLLVNINKYLNKNIYTIYNTADGLRLSDKSRGWFSIRHSNTEPKLITRIEGNNKKSFQSLIHELREILNQEKISTNELMTFVHG